jgi:hypothetical protein
MIAQRSVQRLDAWTIGDRVRVDAAFAKPGDVWVITGLAFDNDGPYASIRLAHRVGGLPLGTTGSAVGVEWLRPASRLRTERK